MQLETFKDWAVGLDVLEREILKGSLEREPLLNGTLKKEALL